MGDGFDVRPDSLPPVVGMLEGRAGDLDGGAAIPEPAGTRLAAGAGDKGLSEAAAIFGAGLAGAVQGLAQDCRLLARSLSAAALAYQEADHRIPWYPTDPQ